MFKFHSLVRSPISAGKSRIPSFPDRLRTDRLTSSLIDTGTHLTLLLLTSSMLRFVNISRDFWGADDDESAVDDPNAAAAADAAAATTADVVEDDVADVVVDDGNISNV